MPVKMHSARGMPGTMFCRIRMFIWPFGGLHMHHPRTVSHVFISQDSLKFSVSQPQSFPTSRIEEYDLDQTNRSHIKKSTEVGFGRKHRRSRKSKRSCFSEGWQWAYTCHIRAFSVKLRDLVLWSSPGALISDTSKPIIWLQDYPFTKQFWKLWAPTH